MAQQQGLLTITGYVGGNPTQFNREGMPHASSFRMASTRRYFDGRTQQWRDLPTTWITVKAYRGLSESICQSFKKGEPVIVSGVLASENWVDQNGKRQSKLVLEANAAGHDLNYGVSTLRKFVKQNGQQEGMGAPAGRQTVQEDRIDANDPSYAQTDQMQEVSPAEALNGQDADAVEFQDMQSACADENAAETPQEEFGGNDF